MSQLAAVFSLSGNGPYLVASFGIALVILVANVVLPLLQRNALKKLIRRDLDLRRNQS